ncbi:hypothetical protein LMB54_10020 [Limosilactobacillus reuteri]|uniref:hypothetical protein n=1 Tax=Limosilactobacillus reuteri TaxID=1598 RepID=UPI001E3B8C76|nr:hypothetical protein [Limosilactobacillus reuteri]MCC4384134.1 hypothetical protein [Limosilactobacillus reuteri]MCC4419976.1 hypothetical protein [Limosilactobacillus reuteri]MCC4421286.1 hypothetical protein [Limosilactobacillus reuteri]
MEKSKVRKNIWGIVLKIIRKFNYKSLIVIFNIISLITLIIQFYLKLSNASIAVICISVILFSIIYFIVAIIDKFLKCLLGRIKHWTFKYETQNLKMLIFNNKWDLNPSYDCLSYISKDISYSEDKINDLLDRSNNFNNVNAFELYQKFVKSLCELSISELKNMNSFLNIKFDSSFSGLLSNNLWISIFLFFLATVFGVDIRDNKVNFNSSYLYKIFKLTNNFSVRLFSIYVLCITILFIIVIWIVKRKQKRTLLVIRAAVKQAIAIKEHDQLVTDKILNYYYKVNLNK